jgi:formylglycine-generating enzyme required for sulfatase activity
MNVRNGPRGPDYVWIPPGTFARGCSTEDSECKAEDEKRTHQVTLTKGFWIGRSEVTQAADERVTRRNPSEFKGASLPVESITWEEAAAYCKAGCRRKRKGNMPHETEMLRCVTVHWTT